MRLIPMTFVAAVALSSPVIAQETATPAVEFDAATVVARVNGKEITVGNMLAVMERLPAQYAELDDKVLYDGILDQLIDQVSIADTLSADPEADSPRVRLIIENERYALLSNDVITAITAEPVPEAELQALYNERFGAIAPKVEYNASHILVATADEAQAIIAEVTGGADFAEVAKAKSTGPSGPNGGELGWFGEGVMVPEFEEAVGTMEAGGISEPVQTQFGWHVIKLNEVRDVPPPALEEVQADLSQELMQQKVEAALDSIRAQADIERVEIDVPVTAIRQKELIANE